MIEELLRIPGALGALAAALVIFGYAPGMVLALIVRLFQKDDPRRCELQAELYTVPRWERPFWVFEKLDLALRQGLVPQVSSRVGGLAPHRAKTESGLECPPPVLRVLRGPGSELH